jgi:hypothetical protein
VIGAPELLRHRRENVVPDRGEAHPELRHPRRPPHEPEVEVLAAVAPAADVDALDVPDCEDRALDADEERPELRLSLGRETVEVAVLSRVEEHDDRQAARSRQRRDEPVLVAPDRVTVPGSAASAVHAVLALARRVVRRRPERPGADLALER